MKYLREHYEGEIEYIGVDLSSELLKFAQKDNPHDTFICNDICKEVLNYEQETFDLIVGTSSFQHIPTQQERSFLIKHFYRILKYEGKFLMLNRTYSDRFVKKYKKQVFLAKLKRFFTL
ncbi:MAG: class I SAM-dependent methyltransferase [Patescibacteria group bacterium]|nr:class I SAM-dependent methyltransferase [Patescibacteria group bacterium]